MIHDSCSTPHQAFSRNRRLSIDFRTPEQMVEAATTAMRRASISGSDQPMSKPFNLTLKLSDQIGVEQRQVLERDLFSTSLTGAGTDRQASQSVKSKLIAQQVYSQLRQHQDTTDDAFANDADVNSSQDSPSMFTYEDIGAPSTIASPANKRRGPVCLHSPALVQRTVLPNTHRVIQHRPGVAKPVMTRSPHDSTLAVGSITQMATDLCSSPSYAKSPYREYKSGQKVRMKSPRRLRKMNRVFWNSSRAVSKSKFQAQLHSAKAVKPADNSDIRPRPPLTATSVSFRGTRGSSNSPRVGGRKPRSQQAPDRTSSRNEGEHFFGPRTATKQHSFGQPQARGRNASEGFSSLSLQSTGHLAPKSLNRGSIGVDGMPVVPSRIFAWNEASAQPSLEHDSSSLCPSPGAVPPPRSGSIRRSIGRASRLHAGEGFSTTLSSLTPRIQSHTQQPQDHPGRDRTSTTAEHSFVDFGDDPSGVVPASTRLSPLQSRASPVAFELSRIAVQSYASSPQGASGGLETSGTVQHAAAVHGSELQSESNEEHSLSSVVHPDANNETSTGHVAATGVDAEAAVPDSAHHPTAPSPSGQSAPAPLKMSLPTACGESPAQETPLSLAAVANESVFYMAGDDSASPPEHVPAPEVQGLQGTPPSAADEPTRVQVDDNDDASVATQVPYEDDDRTA